MSKLQKALNLLRENGGHKPAGSIATDNANNGLNSRRTPDGTAASASEANDERLNARRDFPDVPDSNESLLTNIHRISIDDLKDFSLHPKIGDLELVAQQFRRIKRPILNIAFGPHSDSDENANVIMVASAMPKSGKTFCSFNLTTSIARERDTGAVLVDADVLKPNISRALGLEKRVGLIDYLLDPQVSMDDILVATDLHGIIVVPAGQQHREATELLASRRMVRFVSDLSKRFTARAIVVDTPPLLLTNEAQALAEHMGQIVLVVEAGVTMQESVTQAIATLNRSKPINAILNKARGRSFGEHGADGYSYYGAAKRGV